MFDGAPVESVHGLDLEKPFIDLGYDLFLDRAKFPSVNFTAVDLLDADSDAKNLRGEIDIVYASQIFHLWGWTSQVEVGKAVVKLLKPARRSLIVGYQLGALVAQEAPHAPTKDGKMYLHDPTSMQRLWDEIGQATGTEWVVDAWLDEPGIFEMYTKLGFGLQRISFAIEAVVS